MQLRLVSELAAEAARFACNTREFYTSSIQFSNKIKGMLLSFHPLRCVLRKYSILDSL